MSRFVQLRKYSPNNRCRPSSCLLDVLAMFLAILVVHMATIIGNQSERSKFGLDQSESRISPMWLIDVTTHCIYPRDPHRIKNTRTQELNLHSSHSFNDRVKPWVQAGRVWRPSDVTPIFCINTHNEDRVFASWRKRSWVMDEAIWYSGWNLILTMVWLNGI